MIAEHFTMRTIHTFILRLLADSAEPQTLRGVIHAVASGEEQSFAGEAALLALLARMTPKASGHTVTIKNEPEIQPERSEP